MSFAGKYKRSSTWTKKSSKSYGTRRGTSTKKTYSRSVYKIAKMCDVKFSRTAGTGDYYTGNITYTTMAGNSNIYTLNLVQTGAGSWNRIGRKTKFIGLQARLRLIYDVVKGDLGTIDDQVGDRQVRVLYIHDKAPNGATPSLSSILTEKRQGPSGNETSNWMSPLNVDNIERFKILKDSIYTMKVGNTALLTTAASGSGTLSRPPYSTIKSINSYVKCNVTTNYSADSVPSTIGDISTGAIYLIVLPDGEYTLSTKIEMEGTARLSFVDAQ